MNFVHRWKISHEMRQFMKNPSICRGQTNDMKICLVGIFADLARYKKFEMLLTIIKIVTIIMILPPTSQNCHHNKVPNITLSLTSLSRIVGETQRSVSTRSLDSFEVSVFDLKLGKQTFVYFRLDLV